VGAFKGNRVLDRTCVRIPKSFGRVAVLADIPEVGLTGRFVALGALESQWLVAGVAV
jgi:hypothetical protein